MEQNTIETPDILDDKPQEVKADMRKFNKAKDQCDKAVAALTVFNTITKAEQVALAVDTMKKASTVEKLIENKRKELVKPWNDEVAKINAFAKELTAKVGPAITTVKAALLAWDKKEEKRLKDIRTEQRTNYLTDIGYRHLPTGNELIKGNLWVDSDDNYIVNLSIEEFDDVKWVELLNTHSAKREQAKQKKIDELKQQSEVDHFFGDESAIESKQEAIKELEKPADVVKPSYVPSFGGGGSSMKGKTLTWTFEVENVSNVPREFLMVDEAAVKAYIKNGGRAITGIKIYQKEGFTLR